MIPMIPYFTPLRQYELLREEIKKAIQEVFESGIFIYGKNMEAFEKEFASYCGKKYGIGVGNGTDAIQLALMVLGVRHGDEVITPTNTAMPTAAAITATGATPVFADIDPESFNIDTEKIGERITSRTKAIIPVHLYGQSADVGRIKEIAEKHNLKIIEDCCQAHGAEYKGKKVPVTDLGCFSFYPTKNIGGYGDGGIIVTNNSEIEEKLKLMRDCGQEKRYYYKIKGINSRLDEIHAAMLRVKLKYLEKWIGRRRNIANMYNELIKNPMIQVPKEKGYGKHAYHLYVIKCKKRDKLMGHLAKNGVGTLIHYPIPLHLQEAYKELGGKVGDCSVAESVVKQIVSLPMFPELSDEEIKKISQLINSLK